MEHTEDVLVLWGINERKLSIWWRNERDNFIFSENANILITDEKELI